MLLLFTLVGDFEDAITQIGFLPHRLQFLMEQALSGRFPRIKIADIHVGSEDWQSTPENVKSFADLLNIPVSEVKDDGNSFSKNYFSA